MEYNYDIEWLIDKFDRGIPLDYLFFWGHSKNIEQNVGEFCLSQWFEMPFVVDGIPFKTAEHWMMAHKALLFNDLTSYNKIIKAETPGQAKNLGKQVQGFDQSMWETCRYDIVVKGNIHKFNQHPIFADFLINTGEKILVEASPVDKIWGIGLSKDTEHIDNPHFWNGSNLLGFALMEVRDFLKSFGLFAPIHNQHPLPWKAYPQVEPNDLFWRMGNGEDILLNLSTYYDSLTQKEKTIFRLTNPEPYNWRTFYE